jgi:uncharacterized membrane protein
MKQKNNINNKNKTTKKKNVAIFITIYNIILFLTVLLFLIKNIYENPILLNL